VTQLAPTLAGEGGAMSQQIVPCIWFNGNADEAVDFYKCVFADCEELRRSHYPTSGLADFQQDMAGEVLTIEFTIGDVRLTALNAGSEFKPNPMLSFIVNFDPSRDPDAAAQLDVAWERLSYDRNVLMELGEYPFSKRYGWVQDKYGASWQLMLTDPEGDPRPFLIPSLMFANDNVNRAAEAIDFYTSVFPDSRAGMVANYPEANGEVVAGSVMFGEFAVGSQWFAVMDSPVRHEFDFNEGISLQIECADQAEIDYFWGKLSHVPEAEVCGWCKDQFGVSWQVVPADIDQLMTPENFATMMKMQKIVIADFASE
jgi:predicted 3-demethylubiquinone-9 3-methyltransferase (glyoxalase superfamily)